LNLWKSSTILLASVAVVACGGDIELPVPARMEKILDGDQQRATAGNRLAVPLSVSITADDGSGVPREQVAWSVTQGVGAVLSDTVTVTDGTGLARVYLTLGPEPGTYGVQGALVRKRDAVVTFSADAIPAPALTGINPNTFTSGDVLILTGSGLSDSTVIEIGGVVAQVTTVSPTGQGLSAVVPPCLVPGQVDIQARVGLAGAAPVSGTYQTQVAVGALDLGQHLTVEPAALNGCAVFPDNADTTEVLTYLLAPQSVTSTPGTSVAFRLLGDSTTMLVELQASAPVARSHADRFHDFLRQQEQEQAALPRVPQEEQPFAAPIQLDIKVGDRETFRVCDKITCSAIEDFASVQAEARYVGDHAVIFQDVNAPAGGLVPQDFEELGALFDLDLYDLNTRAFGAESDVDLNGRINILMTPVVNGLTETALCEESFVTGFFFPIDVDPLFASDQRSNKGEVFYAMVPDPDGTVTCDHSVRRVKQLVPVTFVHEMQHMINFYQHVIRRAGDTEETWLNESMSHMAEELAALRFEALGDDQRFAAFSIGDLLNAYKYLSEPERHYPLFSAGTGTLQERGAGWLLLRWIVDQFGEDVLRRLSESGLGGAANLEAATGEPLAKMLPDWFLANYVSDDPDVGGSVSPRLRYDTWNFRTTFNSLHQQDPGLFDRPFPIEPIAVVGGSFAVTGTLAGGSGTYVRVVQNPGQRGFTVQLVDAGGNPLSGEAEPRLNIVRIR
jgi:hypothetical protein